MGAFTIANLIARLANQAFLDYEHIDEEREQLGGKKTRLIDGPDFELPSVVINTNPELEQKETDSETPKPQMPLPQGWDAKGPDRLAWYLPFHTNQRWGVFITANGIEKIAEVLQQRNASRSEALSAAKNFLLAHELGHFVAEVMASNYELLQHRPFYVSGRKVISATSDNGLHTNQHSPNSWLCSAEGLCNALAAATLKKTFKAAMDDWLDRSPEGYSDWRRHKASNRAESWAEVLGGLKHLANGTPASLTTLSIDGSFFPSPGLLKQLQREVPVYLVLDGSGVGGEITDAVVGPLNIIETRELAKDFKKHHEAAKQWRKIRNQLSLGNLQNGANLKPIHDGSIDNLYRVKINKAARVGLYRSNQTWVAFIFDAQHDDFYVRLKAKSEAPIV